MNCEFDPNLGIPAACLCVLLSLQAEKRKSTSAIQSSLLPTAPKVQRTNKTNNNSNNSKQHRNSRSKEVDLDKDDSG